MQPLLGESRVSVDSFLTTPLPSLVFFDVVLAGLLPVLIQSSQAQQRGSLDSPAAPIPTTYCQEFGDQTLLQAGTHSKIVGIWLKRPSSCSLETLWQQQQQLQLQLKLLQLQLQAGCRYSSLVIAFAGLPKASRGYRLPAPPIAEHHGVKHQDEIVVQHWFVLRLGASTVATA